VSITAPGVGFVEGRTASRVARQVNEYLAQLTADHPDRYGAFAVLPLPDESAAIEEVRYALDVFGLDGVGLFTHYRGTYLGEHDFDRLFAMVSERGVTAFVHPTVPPGEGQPTFGLPPSLYEFPFDTTRAVANLLYSGTLDRHRNLRLVISHAGGTVPYLAKRLTHAATINQSWRGRQPADLIGSLRGLFYDTAMSANPHTLAALVSLIDTGNILFGTDFPFMPESTARETVTGVGEFFAGQDRSDVERNNALRLFPRLRTSGFPM